MTFTTVDSGPLAGRLKVMFVAPGSQRRMSQMGRPRPGRQRRPTSAMLRSAVDRWLTGLERQAGADQVATRPGAVGSA